MFEFLRQLGAHAAAGSVLGWLGVVAGDEAAQAGQVSLAGGQRSGGQAAGERRGAGLAHGRAGLGRHAAAGVVLSGGLRKGS
ncbi:MAG: hypothetical protein QXN56_03680 [Candidatus Hadarchaeum sp.]